MRYYNYTTNQLLKMKKKLKLTDLAVQSFVTDLEKDLLKGGAVGSATNCCTGIYPTSPAVACAETGTNHYNCPCDDLNRQNTLLKCLA